MNTPRMPFQVRRIVMLGAAAVAVGAGGIWWQARQQEYRATKLKSEATLPSGRSIVPSPAATASPRATPTPSVTSDSVHREDGNTTVDVSSQSSQSGSGSNYNSNSTSVTIDGQSSTTKTTTVNGHTTTETTP